MQSSPLKISSSCNRLLCSFIIREGNSIAHLLAKYARSCPELILWLEDPPEWLENALFVDSSSINGQFYLWSKKKAGLAPSAIED